jgi:predicted O-methyltransferase YrrM
MHLRDMIGALGLANVYNCPTPEISVMDLQGWNCDDPIFEKLIARVRPEQIIEVGTWKGASAIHMTELAKHYCGDVITICVDTFTGSSAALWIGDEFSGLLTRDEYGFPTTFRQFLHNVRTKDLAQNIIPFPVTATCAAEIMQNFGVQADLIYIDAGHREVEVSLDVNDYWPLLRAGGIMLGDDYCLAWPGVVAAVDKFADLQSVPVHFEGVKWWLEKPAS